MDKNVLHPVYPTGLLISNSAMLLLGRTGKGAIKKKKRKLEERSYLPHEKITLLCAQI